MEAESRIHVPGVEPIPLGGRERLEELRERLHPETNRQAVLIGLHALFAGGHPPDPPPQGFHRGRYLTSTLRPALDVTARRLASLWMPWRGKSFDPQRDRGVNVLDASIRLPLRVLFPGYRPERELDDRIEAFPFRTSVGPDVVDPEVRVLRIEYDHPGNPGLVRRILDELVQVDVGLYLGRIFVRRGGTLQPVGWFMLERP